MMEARVECQCTRIALPDLGISMTKGMVVFMDADKARASEDLQRAWRIKAVLVKFVERFKTRRKASAAPPAPPLLRKTGFMPADAMQADHEAIAACVVERLQAPLDKRIQGGLDQRFQALEDRLVDKIVAAVAVALQSGGISSISGEQPGPAGRISVDGDVPVYIPSRIGGSIQADLELGSTTAVDGAISDAAAALRKARKARDTE